MEADARESGAATAADRAPRRERGFTLLEVVVAVSIATLALVGLFRSGSIGLFAVNQAGRVEEAIERAQSHLAAFGRLDTIVPGDLEGDDGDGYHWRLTATPLTAQPATPDGGTTSAATLYDVKVTISWQAWGGARSVVLDTRRLASAAGSP